MVPASSGASSSRSRGFKEDQFGKKRERSFDVDSLTSTDADVALTPEISMHDYWKFLPHDTLDIVLPRLPFVAQHRFQCVSRRWKGVLSQVLSLRRRPCTIVSESEDGNAKFYCESEKEWFSLASNRPPTFGATSVSRWVENPEITWEVVDAEAGLVLYQSDLIGGFWLWLCNPLRPTLSRLIPPVFRQRTSILDPPKVKLLVDRATKTYKVLALLLGLHKTAVYESTTSRWLVFDELPKFREAGLFVYRNKFYAWHKTGIGFQMSAFMHGRQSRVWYNFKVSVPSSISVLPCPTPHAFLSHSNELLLVLFSQRGMPQPNFSIWKLQSRGRGSLIAPRSTFTRWEELGVVTASGEAVTDLAGYHLVDACAGSGCIWFTFRAHDEVRNDGSRIHKCVRYTFATRTWDTIQYPRRGAGNFASMHMYYWEPSLDAHADLDFTDTPASPDISPDAEPELHQ